MNPRSVRTGRGLVVLGCAAALAAAGCGGSSSSGTAVPVSSTPGTATPAAPTVTLSATSVPDTATTSSTPTGASPTSVDTVGGEAYQAVALTAGEVPAGYTAQKVTAAQALAVQQNVLQGATVNPPGCGTVDPITAQSAKSGLVTTFVMLSTQQALTEFLAPAGAPALDALAAAAAGCRSVTITIPAKGVTITGSVEVIPAPPVAANKTLGLRTSTSTVVAGGPPVTVVQTNYLAETKGTLVSVDARGGPSGAPLDPAVVTEVFTKAVQKVTTHP